jgi:hypothetical protein
MRRVLLLSALGVGCSAVGDPFVAALPTREAIAIRVPGDSPGGTSAASQQALLGAQADFYTLTRQISFQVNGSAATLLTMIEKAVASPPTTQSGTHTFWGPFTDALSPMTVMLAVNRVSGDDYMFFLGGKPKGAPDSVDFTGLMGGTSHRVDAAHGSGQIDVNFTGMNALDPTVNRATGILSIVHDNTADPRTVEAHFGNFLDGKPGSTPLNAHYQYTERADRSGTFKFLLLTNFDTDPQNVLEVAEVSSRWLGSGAGRADLVAMGGSLPAGVVVRAAECWSASFARTYYTENVDPAKTEGAASACALP